MLDIPWRDLERASWIREQTKVEDILSTLKRKGGHRQDTLWDEEITGELNGNPVMLKDYGANRKLDGEMIYKMLLE